MSERSYGGPERRAGPRQGLAPLLAATLDEVDHGLLVVRQDLSVVFANHAARKAVRGLRVLSLTGGHLKPALPQDVQTLQVAIAAARDRHIRTLLRLALDGEAVDISVTPIKGSLHVAAGPNACLLKLGRQAVAHDLSAAAFAKLYGLSGREQDVLVQLCKGLKPADIALALHLSLATVRTHIHNLRRKAGAPDVVDLMRKVASVPSLEAALKEAMPEV